jgi:hypothetical protein
VHPRWWKDKVGPAACHVCGFDCQP